jgi:sugar/nucleoside kinase (ribokinase family)
MLTSSAKTFHYTTPVLSVAPSDLKGTNLLASRAFHILCEPGRLQHHLSALLDSRSSLNLQRPLVIWEPSPPACQAENILSCLQAIKEVDVFSPNHLELLSLFGMQNEPFSKAKLEDIASQCLNSGIGTDCRGIAVIRAGEFGCMLMSRDQEALWVPPYYRSENVALIPSNAFLGGLAIGYHETGSWHEACCYGTVAASFVLEQIGVPVLDRRSGTEYWNGENARDRLTSFRKCLEMNNSACF